MIPVGARLAQREVVGVGFAGRDARKAVETRRAIMMAGHEKPVPVDRRHLRKLVAQVDGDIVSLPKAKDGAGDAAIERDDGVATARIHFQPFAFRHQIDCYITRGHVTRGAGRCGQQQTGE